MKSESWSLVLQDFHSTLGNYIPDTMENGNNKIL